jgi:hypothetical protein
VTRPGITKEEDRVAHSHDRTLLARLGFADPDKREPRHDLACQHLALPENHERLARMMAEPMWAKSAGPGKRVDRVYCPHVGGDVNRTFRFERTFERLAPLAPALEVLIGKGEDQYRTTVGFLDAVLPFTFVEVRRGEFDGAWVAAEHIEARVPKYNPRDADGRVKVERCDLPEEHRTAFPARGVYVEARVEGNGFICSVPLYRASSRAASEEEIHKSRIAVEVKIGRVGVGEVLRQIGLYREHMRSAYWVVAAPYTLDATDLATLRAAGVAFVRLGPKFDAWCAARAAEAPDPAASPEF